MKNLGFVLLVAGLIWVATTLTTSAQTAEKYVRKQPQPNFFIPQGELSQHKPEKVYIPHYKKGKSTAKHISAYDNIKKENIKIVKQTKEPVNIQEYVHEPDPHLLDYTGDMTARENVDPNQITQDKSYQEMYQSYLQDLKAIALDGQPKDNNTIKDLREMNSDERINLDKQFNSLRDVNQEIKQATENK